jgi:uncharacterized membrane protein (Fun14 family)
MLEINSDHILGTVIGFLAGYLTGVFTSKLLKMVIGIVILSAAGAYIYFRYFKQEIPEIEF